jgi:hypothetical protein
MILNASSFEKTMGEKVNWNSERGPKGINKPAYHTLNFYLELHFKTVKDSYIVFQSLLL